MANNHTPFYLHENSLFEFISEHMESPKNAKKLALKEKVYKEHAKRRHSNAGEVLKTNEVPNIEGQTSPSYIQRKLKCSYPEACNFLSKRTSP